MKPMYKVQNDVVEWRIKHRMQNEVKNTHLLIVITTYEYKLKYEKNISNNDIRIQN